jgi:ATP-dependent DNA helicase
MGDSLEQEEEKARADNEKADAKKRSAARAKAKARRKKKVALTPHEKQEKARQLEDLLKKTGAFSDILTGKTKALGRMGTAMDGKALGEHELELAPQPKCMVGGTMRDYQLEGLTWMREIAIQGMSGILADEMGLGMYRPLVSSYEFAVADAYLLLFPRQNYPDHIPRRFAARGRVLRAISHRCAPQHALQLDR